jgi:hypothetical protein
MSRREHSGRATRRDNSGLVTLLIPRDTILQIDSHVCAADTDRAKFIRAAIREKMERELSAPSSTSAN